MDSSAINIIDKSSAVENLETEKESIIPPNTEIKKKKKENIMKAL